MDKPPVFNDGTYFTQSQKRSSKFIQSATLTQVFYKIYTHRPVTDVCSFCPRDYAALAQRRRRKEPGTRKQSGAGEEDWYLRWENNGWRPVSERLLQPVDPVTARTAAVR